MSILQKRAWLYLAVVSAAVLIAGIIIDILVRVNAEGGGFGGVIPILVGITVGFICYIRSIPKENQLDEREKMIARKSFEWSSKTFIVFMAIAMFGFFGFFDAREKIPVYFLPYLFMTGLFFAQLVESATILIWCAKEQQNG